MPRRANLCIHPRRILVSSWISPFFSSQRWVGANTDPDFFEYAFSSKRFPPDGANRGHYRNARIDAPPTIFAWR